LIGFSGYAVIHHDKKRRDIQREAGGPLILP
jgi:hypothetical protein